MRGVEIKLWCVVLRVSLCCVVHSVLLRAFNLEMLFSVCCVPIDCVGETILRGECFLRKELVYLGVKTSVETADYNLLLVSIY